MKLEPRRYWRAFPWNPAAAAGEPNSPGYVSPNQGHGRFDLPDSPTGVLYLAESPEHALAEKLQDLRNQRLADDDLREGGHRYGICEVELPERAYDDVADLCDPATIARLGPAPDHVAALSRETTQAVAVRLHDAGHTGFRWWSVFFGEWHTVVLFRDRLAGAPVYAEPRAVHTTDPALRLCAERLGIELPG